MPTLCVLHHVRVTENEGAIASKGPHMWSQPRSLVPMRIGGQMGDVQDKYDEWRQWSSKASDIDCQVPPFPATTRPLRVTCNDLQEQIQPLLVRPQPGNPAQPTALAKQAQHIMHCGQPPSPSFTHSPCKKRHKGAPACVSKQCTMVG